MLLASVAFKQAGKSRAHKIFNCGENIPLISSSFEGKNTEENWEKMDELVMKDIIDRLGELTGGRKEKLKIRKINEGTFNEVGVFENKKGESRFAWRKMIEPITVVTINFTDSESDTDDSASPNVKAKEELENQYKEYRLSCELSKRGITPKIVGLVDASIITTGRNNTERHTKLYQIMESYDSEVTDILSFYPELKRGREVFNSLETKLAKMFKDISKMNIVCGDLKSQNSVFKFNNNSRKIEDFEVKLIDWDVTFCIQSKTDTKKNNKLKYYSMLVLYSLASEPYNNFDRPLFKDKLETYLKKKDNSKKLSTFLLKTHLPCGITLAQMIYHYYGNEHEEFTTPPSYEEWDHNKEIRSEWVEELAAYLTMVYIDEI